MSGLPRISGAEAVRAFSAAGWTVVRQKGSHVVMVKEGQRDLLVVPMHSELDRGTLRALIRISGLSVEEFRLLR
jgi:predicted RNA binding protein YcfA (HicA-like mRNA interferase family)